MRIEDGLTALERRDYATALQVIRPLAENGNAEGQYYLGVLYANGQGVPQDDSEAVKWFRAAALQGAAEAQYNLGCMYANGQGVLQDDAEALKWYSEAAEQGAAEAHYNLGFVYVTGRGVPPDYVRAYVCFDLAVAGGIEMSVKNRDAIAARMTAAEVTEAQKLAREWQQKKAGGN